MTLNFSHRPMFPPPNVPSGSGFIPSIQDKGGDVFGRPCCAESGTNDSYIYGRGDSPAFNTGGSWEPKCTDIADLLPSDPFGMNLDSTFKAAIAFCIGDMATNYQCDQIRENHAEFNHYNAVTFPPEAGQVHSYSDDLLDEEIPGLLECTPKLRVFSLSPDSNYDFFRSDWTRETWDYLQVQEQVDFKDIPIYGEEIPVSQRPLDAESSDFLLQKAGGQFDGLVESRDGEAPHKELLFEEEEEEEDHNCAKREYGEPPHEGLLFALRHLGVQDLLSVERVCNTLRYAVQKDPLLWRCFHIQQPLNEKLTDEALFQLTQRAEGRLQCLNLVECVGITDVGLRRVIERNPEITKLNVSGCARLTVEGIVNSLKLYKTPRMPYMEYVGVGGIYGATLSNYEDIKLLVGLSNCERHHVHKQRYYHNGFSSSSCDYGTAIDIELCPRCQDLRLVYDCPTENCQGKACRACTLCIPRCANCGRCLNDDEYEETFCLEFVCMDCWTCFAQCEKDQNQEGEIGANSTKIMPLVSRRMGASAFSSVVIMDYE